MCAGGTIIIHDQYWLALKQHISIEYTKEAHETLT